MKSLVIRCHKRGESLPEAIADWRNMAGQDGTTPSQLRQRQNLPMLPDVQTNNQDVSARDKLHEKRIENRNKHTIHLPELPEGMKVLLQHHVTKQCDTHTIILKRRENGHSYIVRTSVGKTIIRGRRLTVLSPHLLVK